VVSVAKESLELSAREPEYRVVNRRSIENDHGRYVHLYEFDGPSDPGDDD